MNNIFIVLSGAVRSYPVPMVHAQAAKTVRAANTAAQAASTPKSNQEGVKLDTNDVSPSFFVVDPYRTCWSD